MECGGIVTAISAPPIADFPSIVYLTNHVLSSNKYRDSDPNGQVCEITSEMEGAGVDAFFRIDCVEDSPQEIVREIYQAMSRQAEVHPPV